MLRDRRERPPEDVGFGGVDVVPPPTSPIDWWKLDDLGRAETLVVMGEWVPEFVRRYGLGDQWVPPCWYRHEPVLQELLGFYQLRQQSQFAELAPPTAPNEFHKELYLLKLRLREIVGATGCNTAEHFDQSHPAWVRAGAAHALWEEELSSFIEEQLSEGWPDWSAQMAKEQ